MSPPAAAREFNRWAEAFDRTWNDPDSIDGLWCPTCSTPALNLVYVVDELEASHGMFAFWCGACLTGFPPGVGPVAGGARRIRRGEESVPNYRLVVDE